MTANPKREAKPEKKKNISRFLIVLVLISLATAVGYIIYRQLSKEEASAGNRRTEEKTIPVVVTTPQTRDFERSFLVQGNIEAKNFAMVSPRIPGTVVSVFVDEGRAVTAGKTKLFQTDAANLKENVEIGRHDLTVARCAKEQAVANLEKTRADLHKAKLDYERFERLLEKEAVTVNAFEQQESRYLQLQAAEKLARAQVNLAAAQERQSRAALAISEKNLADATIYAPIDGKVSARLLEPGEMGSPGVPVLRIDDTNVVEVSAFLPAQYYPQIVPGSTLMKIRVAGIDVGRYAVTYKSPTINPKLRTFEVKCLLTAPPDGVAPGGMAQLNVILESREGLGVPTTAVQQRGGQDVVFVVKEKTSHQVTVRTGIEKDGWIEIMTDEIEKQDLVVTMGQDMLEEGSSVSIQRESN